ncbi:hypothetical protein PN462_14490 [Spirulina sp. CS-785/01]|uniref:hypothetical protein n=1 Tax=Spirulina sp. CS-785/01 TaxID=3021716 RepID=UPI00232D8D09|nr:hypothetical protein [Spirulina sp. CS-785/01]MDB9314319.1 hypothetical protein [Spirulina sp. CS-785/01]
MTNLLELKNEIQQLPPDEIQQLAQWIQEYLGDVLDDPIEAKQKQQEDQKLAEACALVDELELGWESEWQQVAITDSEASG